MTQIKIDLETFAFSFRDNTMTIDLAGGGVVEIFFENGDLSALLTAMLGGEAGRDVATTHPTTPNRGVTSVAEDSFDDEDTASDEENLNDALGDLNVDDDSSFDEEVETQQLFF